MNELHTEHRGEFRWLAIAYDEPAGVRVTLADLPCGLFLERVDGRGEPLVSVADSEGCEITLTVAQVTELRTALGELPGPVDSGRSPVVATPSPAPGGRSVPAPCR